MMVERYSAEKREEWDGFIRNSRNGTFLFERGYMDYHSDRFRDHSLMYRSDKGRLLSVMAANEADSPDGGRVLHSHQGLTYGGLVLAPATKMVQVLDIFEETVAYLKGDGFAEWHYKQVPVCYHCLPSQEDEYALWKYGAELINCGISSDIVLDKDSACNAGLVNATKRYYCAKLLRGGYVLERNAQLDRFWPILEDNLMRRHRVAPVHSLAEMKLLQSRFPERIECVAARNSANEMEAGVVIYKMNDVVHVQYMSASSEGRRHHTLDFLIISLVDQLRKEGSYKFLDFGISTEEGGRFLNEGLIAQKESLGGRGVIYKEYKIRL